MGFGHRVVGVATTLAVPLGLARFGVHTPPGEVVAAVVLAVPFSAGRLSPDADLPRGKLHRLGHRRGVHGWWWPGLAGAALVWFGLGGIYSLWGPIIGWSSHLAADAVFGKAGYGTPRGIPVVPFAPWRLGLGLKVAGEFWGHAPLELVATWIVLAGAVPYLVWATLNLAW